MVIRVKRADFERSERSITLRLAVHRVFGGCRIDFIIGETWWMSGKMGVYTPIPRWGGLIWYFASRNGFKEDLCQTAFPSMTKNPVCSKLRRREENNLSFQGLPSWYTSGMRGRDAKRLNIQIYTELQGVQRPLALPRDHFKCWHGARSSPVPPGNVTLETGRPSLL